MTRLQEVWKLARELPYEVRPMKQELHPVSEALSQDERVVAVGRLKLNWITGVGVIVSDRTLLMSLAQAVPSWTEWVADLPSPLVPESNLVRIPLSAIEDVEAGVGRLTIRVAGTELTANSSKTAPGITMLKSLETGILAQSASAEHATPTAESNINERGSDAQGASTEEPSPSVPDYQLPPLELPTLQPPSEDSE